MIRYSVILLMTILFNSTCFANTLYVFYPSTIRTRTLQQKLQNGCPDINISVFGRFKDFNEKVKIDQPNAILTKTPVVEYIGGYTIKLKGNRNGKIVESFVLLSVDAPVTLDNLAGESIGVFAILGRKEMKKYIGGFIHGKHKLKRVSKMEDFLPLLAFNMAKAILVPDYTVEYFQRLSKLNFVNSPVPNMEVEIITLALKDINSSAAVASIKGLNNDLNSLLEVDKWIDM